MEKILHPVTHTPLWRDKENGLSLDDISQFIKEFHYPDCTLSIYDIITDHTMEIDCSIENISNIVGMVSAAEHSFVNYIGIVDTSKSYSVGIMFTRGNFDFGCYKYEDGKLKMTASLNDINNYLATLSTSKRSDIALTAMSEDERLELLSEMTKKFFA